jgi:8-oxo-dGTP diphosphatase
MTGNHADRYRLLAAIHVFLIKDNKVLLLRRFQTGYEDGKYSVPAGHVEENEPVTASAAREALEEAGITIEPSDLRVKHVMHLRTDDERIDFFFWVKKWQGEPSNTEPEKCDEVRWVDLNDLPENVIPYVRSALQQCQSNTFYSEYGWE